MRAAREVFERDGFLDARIADITATARTATGSFYTYFTSKEEIFLAVVDELSDEVASIRRRWSTWPRRRDLLARSPSTTAPTSRPTSATRG